MISPCCRLRGYLLTAFVIGLASIQPALAQKIIFVKLHSLKFTSTMGLAAGSGRQVGTADSKGILWTGSASSAVSLTFSPTGVSDDQVVGNTSGTQAILYNVSTQTSTTLNPTAFPACQVKAVSEGCQVGYGAARRLGQGEHALMWKGTAASAVDLHPVGFDRSFAYAVSKDKQVGAGLDQKTTNFHALYWQGTAASGIDIHPPNFDNSYAYGVGGNQIAGSGDGPATGGAEHALMWTNSGVSVIDLNPNGFDSSRATATNGTRQVGWGVLSSSHARHALVWFGDASTVIDLHDTLPTGFTDSMATGTDQFHNVVGSARDSKGNWQAVLWRIVPGFLSDHGGNAGQLTVRLVSAGDFILTPGTTVTLTMPGQPDIVGLNPNVSNAGYMTTTFDLKGAPPGVRDAILTFPDNSTKMLPAVFTVEEGGKVAFDVQVVGPTAVRSGRTATYQIFVRNIGNIDASPAAVWISFPDYFQWTWNDNQGTIITVQNGSDIILVVPLTSIPGSRSNTFAVGLIPPSDPKYAHQNFTIRAGASTH